MEINNIIISTKIDKIGNKTNSIKVNSPVSDNKENVDINKQEEKDWTYL